MEPPALLPKPQEIKMVGGEWTFPATITILVNAAGRRAADILEKDLADEWTVDISLREEFPGGEYAVIALGTEDALAEISFNDILQGPPGEPEFGAMTRNREYFPGEDYFLEVTSTGIVIWGASPRGAFYGTQTALQLLRQAVDGAVPCLTIHDWPTLEIRGAHVDLKEQLHTVVYYKSLFRRFAEWKLNVVLLELEDKFPFQRVAAAVSKNALFSPALEDLLAEADRLFLEVIPLHQSLSHLRWLLRHPSYASLVESAGDGSGELELCPSNPEALALATELYDEIVNSFPSRFVHIGGDEHRHLGACPTCADFVKNHPQGAFYAKGELYGKFIAEIAAHLRASGKIPIAWSDCVLQYPSALDFLPAGTLLFHYWEYDVSRANPQSPGDYDPEFQINTPRGSKFDWVRLGSWKFPASDLKHAPEELRQEYGDYCTPDDAGLFPAYPFFDYFWDKGYQAIAGPAIQCCTRTPDIPHYSQHHPNVRLHAEVAANANAAGLIATNWVIRGVPFECAVYGFALAAEAAWLPVATSNIMGFYQRFGATYFGITDARWVGIVPRMGVRFYPDKDPYWAEVTAGAGEVLEDLGQNITRNSLSFGFLKWALAHRTLEWNFTRTMQTIEDSIISVDEGERDGLPADELGALVDDVLGLVDQVVIMQEATSSLFQLTYHAGELAQELETRFAGKIDYLELLSDLLEAYPVTHNQIVEAIIARRVGRSGSV